jgi:hypothetical protein
MVTKLADIDKTGNTGTPSELLSRNTDSFRILRLFLLSREKTARLLEKEKAKPHSYGLYSNLGQSYEPAIADDYMG